MARNRAGFVAMEAMVALVLTAIVGAALCTTLVAQSRVARSIGDRIAYNGVVRATQHIVGTELRFNNASDMRAIAAESLGGRWFRASGTPCAVNSTVVWARFRGIRSIDVRKDSILVLTPAREIAADAATLGVDNSKCSVSGDETIYRIPATALNTASADVIAVMIFESGNYYLSTHALRYRIGGEGRQPLTEENFRDGASRFAWIEPGPAGSARIRLTLVLKPSLQQTAGRTINVALPVSNDLMR